ncbi:MAG: hypothetical protein DRH17_12535 [Deltaproteobacteria bacterium]|nr:MAG: hypothetical protein DRH17_12535 [Deltaproteobacteria bacterium]
MVKLQDILNKLGNDIMSVIVLSRNLGYDFQELVEELSKTAAAKHSGLKKEPLHFRDRMIAVVRTKDGKIKLDEKGRPMIRDTGWSLNGITNAGLAEVAGLILTDVGGTAFDYIAIGTGTTAFDATQTALEAEVARKAGTGSRVTTSVTNDTAQLVATFSSADGLSGTHAITESGVFNASTGGTMLCRQTFAALNINWDAGDSLQVTWKIQITSA